jgi:8-oxo-dGTP pyrophosphatase MutT (NUDIX family)
MASIESNTGSTDGHGPSVRTDVVDVYVFRRAGSVVHLLQLRRVHEPLAGTWQPIMGHIESGESASHTAVRELREEVGLHTDSSDFIGLWALEQVSPFYIARLDVIVMSPRFACEVSAHWMPRLDDEHDAARWVRLDDADRSFLWPGQLAAIGEIERSLLPADSPSREILRVNVG